jgi:hypothetical protein
MSSRTQEADKPTYPRLESYVGTWVVPQFDPFGHAVYYSLQRHQNTESDCHDSDKGLVGFLGG